MKNQGLFIGLLTLDLIYLTGRYPQQNEKVVASNYTVAAGGPATNAAVTFSGLGDEATLLSVAGQHPIIPLIKADLFGHRINLIDLDGERLEPLPISSIIVTENTGDRAVISLNAIKSQIVNYPPNLNTDLAKFQVILIDGHQIAISRQISELAKQYNIPVVLDGGSWKPGLEDVLPYVNYALCSANFYPPNCHNSAEVCGYLRSMNIPHIAITHGENSIEYISQNQVGNIPVPQITPVDTLGAGDIFHGAFCHYIIKENFTQAIASAAKVASYSCQYFGTRQWLETKGWQTFSEGKD